MKKQAAPAENAHTRVHSPHTTPAPQKLGEAAVFLPSKAEKESARHACNKLASTRWHSYSAATHPHHTAKRVTKMQHLMQPKTQPNSTSSTTSTSPTSPHKPKKNPKKKKTHRGGGIYKSHVHSQWKALCNYESFEPANQFQTIKFDNDNPCP